MAKYPVPSRLIAELERRQWSLNELARRSGVNATSISDSIRGKQRVSRESAEKIARALGVQATTIFNPQNVHEDDFSVSTADNPLAKARKRKQLSQETLARLTNIERPSISRYEAGTQIPSPSSQRALARALGVKVEVLFGHLIDENLRPQPGDSRLTAARKSKGWYRHDLAHRIKVSDEDVRLYETGQAFPSIKTLRLLYLVLGKRPGQLFDISGSWLRKARIEALLDAKEVANRLKLNYATYRRYEAPNGRVPKDIALRLSQMFKLPVEYLFNDSQLTHPAQLIELQPVVCADRHCRKSQLFGTGYCKRCHRPLPLPKLK